MVWVGSAYAIGGLFVPRSGLCLEYWMTKKITLLVACLLLGYALIVHTAFQMLAAGVAIFLFGMLFMEQGFKALTGGVLEKVLAWSTDRFGKSMAFGLVATALMQSSSLVTVITISTLSASLITLAAGIGIVFGANIGTTTGAWLMAYGMKVSISTYAMPMIVIGLVLLFQKEKGFKGLGNVLAGVGFVFLGIHYMKEGFSIFSSSFDLAQFAISGRLGLLVYTLIGVVATVVMQSSHATLLLTIASLSAGQVTYDNALALAIGSNIGTTITAIIGSLSANAEGKRLAYAHVLFNLITGAIAIVLISPFMWCVDMAARAIGIAADNWTLKLATFHTLFNVVGVVVVTPFVGLLVRFLEDHVHGTPSESVRGVAVDPLYLNASALALPDTAIEVLLKESQHLLENVFEVIAHGLNLHREDIASERDLEEVIAASTEIMAIEVTQRYYASVKSIYSAIIDFATRAVAAADMSESQVACVQNIRLACREAAEIIKALATLRPNLNRYMASDNEAMRAQYNLMRKNMAQCVRRMVFIAGIQDQQVAEAALAGTGEDLARQDVLADDTVDRLMRDGAVTPQMATSLMNDSAAALHISKRLHAISEHLAAAQAQAPGVKDA